MTPTLQHKATGPGEPSGPWHRWTGIATVLGTVIGGLGLIVALLAWLLPRQNDPAPAHTATTTVAEPPSGTPSTANPSAAGPAAVFLDATGLTPEAGADRLVAVPRDVRGQAGYASHPLAIRCPSNQTGDTTSEVTFLLRGRYVQFDATVHPYYPAGPGRDSVTYVTVRTAVREKDTTLTTTEAASQKNASFGRAERLSAAVDDAEKVVLSVQCEDPAGTIVLTDARLTPR